MQVVPLCFEPTFPVEYLDTMVFAIRDINPTIRVTRDVVRDVELPRQRATLAPGFDEPPVGRVPVDARVAVAVCDIDVALRREPYACSGGMAIRS